METRQTRNCKSWFYFKKTIQTRAQLLFITNDIIGGRHVSMATTDPTRSP